MAKPDQTAQSNTRAHILAALLVVALLAMLGIKKQQNVCIDRAKFKRGADQIATLSEELDSSVACLRSQAALDAQQFGSEASALVPKLVERLDDPDDSVRWRAAAAFGYIGETTPKGYAKLKELLIHDPNQTVRYNSVFALANVELSDKGADLAPALKDQVADVRRNAIAYLREDASPADRQLLSPLVRTLLKDPLPLIRQIAAEASGTLFLIELKDDVATLTSDPDKDVRESAARTVAHFAQYGSDAEYTALATRTERGPLTQQETEKLVALINSGSSEAARTVAVCMLVNPGLASGVSIDPAALKTAYQQAVQRVQIGGSGSLRSACVSAGAGEMARQLLEKDEPTVTAGVSSILRQMLERERTRKYNGPEETFPRLIPANIGYPSTAKRADYKTQLKNSSPLIRFFSALSLSRFTVLDGNSFRSLLADSDPRVQALALLAVAPSLPPKEYQSSEPVIQQMMTSSNPELKSAALQFASGRTVGRDSVDAYLAALASADESVRQTGRSGLKHLSENGLFPPNRWATRQAKALTVEGLQQHLAALKNDQDLKAQYIAACDVSEWSTKGLPLKQDQLKEIAASFEAAVRGKNGDIISPDCGYEHFAGIIRLLDLSEQSDFTKHLKDDLIPFLISNIQWHEGGTPVDHHRDNDFAVEYPVAQALLLADLRTLDPSRVDPAINEFLHDPRRVSYGLIVGLGQVPARLGAYQAAVIDIGKSKEFDPRVKSEAYRLVAGRIPDDAQLADNVVDGVEKGDLATITMIANRANIPKHVVRGQLIPALLQQLNNHDPVHYSLTLTAAMHAGYDDVRVWEYFQDGLVSSDDFVRKQTQDHQARYSRETPYTELHITPLTATPPFERIQLTYDTNPSAVISLDLKGQRYRIEKSLGFGDTEVLISENGKHYRIVNGRSLEVQDMPWPVAIQHDLKFTADKKNERPATATYLEKPCRVYSSQFGEGCFWNGLALRFQSKYSQGEAYPTGTVRELRLNPDFPAELFQPPPGLKPETRTEEERAKRRAVRQALTYPFKTAIVSSTKKSTCGNRSDTTTRVLRIDTKNQMYRLEQGFPQPRAPFVTIYRDETRYSVSVEKKELTTSVDSMRNEFFWDENDPFLKKTDRHDTILGRDCVIWETKFESETATEISACYWNGIRLRETSRTGNCNSVEEATDIQLDVPIESSAFDLPTGYKEIGIEASLEDN